MADPIYTRLLQQHRDRVDPRQVDWQPIRDLWSHVSISADGLLQWCNMAGH